MIKDIFSQVERNTLQYIDDLRADAVEYCPRDITAKHIVVTKSKLIRWSRRAEEEVAQLMHEYQQVAEKMNEWAKENEEEHGLADLED
jgi:hypothetical protein